MRNRIITSITIFLVILVVLELVVKHKPHFDFDGMFAFAPVVGFVGVVLFAGIGVVVATLLGRKGERE